METVIKVSGNKRQEPEPEPAVEAPPVVPAPPPAELEPESTLESIIHHSWGHRHDRKEVPEVGLRPQQLKLAISSMHLRAAHARWHAAHCLVSHPLKTGVVRMHHAQVQPPPPVPAATPAAAAAAMDRKQRARSRMEAIVESEVDRLIDSQDNEYVLSRPKCAPRLGHPHRPLGVEDERGAAKTQHCSP